MQKSCNFPTAQTIVHIVIEQASGRLDRPALVVVPTTLVPNWSAELARFAPHLRVQSHDDGSITKDDSEISP